MKFTGMVALAAICLLLSNVHSADGDSLRLPSTADTLHTEDGLPDTLGRRRVTFVPSLNEGVRGLMVPLVETDTSTYEKRFWLSEKRIVSVPDVDARNAVIVGVDSSVCIVFSYKPGGDKHLYSTWSMNHGMDWSDPTEIQVTGSFDGGQPYLSAHHSDIYLVNTMTANGTRDVVFRRACTGDGIWSDSVVVVTVPESIGYAFRPSLGSAGDTVFASYTHVLNDFVSTVIEFSIDQGETWYQAEGAATDISGRSFLVVDSVLIEVYSPSAEVWGCRSLDRGDSWEPVFPIAADDEYASQSLAAATDGVSAVHVAWYDYEGKTDPTCFGGYPYYRRSLDCGETWDEIKSMSDRPCSDEPYLFADSARVYAAWSDDRTGSPDYSVYLRYSHDRGDTWCPEIQIVDEVDPAWATNIYAWRDYVYIIWREQHPPDWIWQTMYILGAWYTPGDIDMSGSIDIADLVYMVMYMFQEGPQPWVMGAVEMDGAEGINIADLVYLAMYMFQEGPPPIGAPEP